jgi:hypothetical protein
MLNPTITGQIGNVILSAMIGAEERDDEPDAAAVTIASRLKPSRPHT